MINGDYFDAWTSSTTLPRGAVASQGRMLFSPHGWSKVVVAKSGKSPRTTRIRYEGALHGPTRSLVATALNDPGADDSVVVEYDANWQSELSLGKRWSIVVHRGMVVRTIAPGTSFKIQRGQRVFTTTERVKNHTWRRGTKVKVNRRIIDITGSHVASASGHGGYALVDRRIIPLCSRYENVPRPRTMMAWNEAGSVWLIVAGPGRPDPANGIRVGGATKTQIADLARRLGATHAVNLDGGGSSIMAVKDKGSWDRIDNSSRAWLRPFPVGWSVNLQR